MRVPVIVRKTESGLVAFFPGQPANYGNIQAFSKQDGHGEWGVSYYQLTHKASDREISEFIAWYQAYSDSLPGEKEEYYPMHRLTYALEKKAWGSR